MRSALGSYKTAQLLNTLMPRAAQWEAVNKRREGVVRRIWSVEQSIRLVRALPTSGAWLMHSSGS